jgi:hypothetical protein
VSDQASDFLSKIKYGKIAAIVRTTWIPVRTRYSLSQVRNSNSTIRTTAYHGPDARMTNMEIACNRSPVRTAILLVRTSEAFIRKLLAVDVRRSGSRSQTGKILIENLKILVAQLSVRIAHDHRPDGAQLYQARCSFESSAYK